MPFKFHREWIRMELITNCTWCNCELRVFKQLKLRYAIFETKTEWFACKWINFKLITIHWISLKAICAYNDADGVGSFAKLLKLTIKKSINTLFTVNNSRPLLELRQPQRCVFNLRAADSCLNSRWRNKMFLLNINTNFTPELNKLWFKNHKICRWFTHIGFQRIENIFSGVSATIIFNLTLLFLCAFPSEGKAEEANHENWIL